MIGNRLLLRLLLPSTLVAVSLAPVAAGSPEPGYRDYGDWRGWSRVVKNTVTGLASSWDRLGGNADYSQYESPPGYTPDAMPATIATLDGPGVIYRFWMPHGTANQDFQVKLFFDDEPTPRIDTTSAPLFAGSYSYFDPPLVNTAAGGQTCYTPIPFRESVRIETFNQQLPPTGFSVLRHYYQYSYRLFPCDDTIASYDGVLDAGEQAALDQLVNLFGSAGEHPAGADPATKWAVVGATTLNPAESIALADVAGPAVIRQLNISPATTTDDALQSLRLVVTYDEEPAPAIDVAVADFFAAGYSRAAYASLPIGTLSADGYYSYWPMPFHRRAQVSLRNAGAAQVSINSARVGSVGGGVGADSGYFRARVNTTTRAAGSIYHPMLQTTGRGHYVGSFLYLRQSSFNFTMLEGDDVIFADSNPPILGTGLEDAYNGGYYYNWVLIQPGEPEGPSPQSSIRPLHGIVYVHRNNTTPIARADQYRWLIGDRVTFSNSIDVRIENRYADVGGTWTSVAFWYQQPEVRGDGDDDGDLDLHDIGRFQRCYPNYAGGCGPEFDLDNDADVDATDFERFSGLINGPW